jgi:hypothetical protein
MISKQNREEHEQYINIAVKKEALHLVSHITHTFDFYQMELTRGVGKIHQWFEPCEQFILLSRCFGWTENDSNIHFYNVDR